MRGLRLDVGGIGDERVVRTHAASAEGENRMAEVRRDGTLVVGSVVAERVQGVAG